MAKETNSILDMSKWIVDSGCTNYITPFKCSFYIYQVVVVSKVWMNDNGMVEAME
jgi:hypothetical protein